MDADFRDQPRTRRARIATLLKQAGLTRRSQPPHELIQPPRARLANPHQQWQMDAASDHAGRGGRQGQFDPDCRYGEEKVYSYLAQGRWFRSVGSNGLFHARSL